jgi:diguanylate cyclase (GGDEF)-like protein/PAS domain S-box-containing protein
MPDSVDLAAQVAAETADILFVFRIAPTMACEFMSPSVERHMGWTAAECQADPTLIARLVHPDDLHILQAADDLPVGENYDFEVRWQHRDGRTVWMQERLRKQVREDGAVVLYGSARDITAFKDAEKSLAETEELYRLIAENSLDVVYRASSNMKITWVSPSVLEVLGWSPEEFKGMRVLDVAHPDDLKAAQAVRARVLDRGEAMGEVEVRFATKSGAWRWMRVRGKPLRDAQGRLVGGVDVLQDIQREVDVRERLAHEAHHDPLTGLGNRASAVRHIDLALEGAPIGSVAVLAVGLDDLKSVNESLTYTAGDRVLVAVAERLVKVVGARGSVSRVAGNEFAVVLGRCDEDEAAHTASQILDAASDPVRLGVHELDVSTSIGIARSDHRDAESLLADASLALHQAKGRGRGRWEFVDPAASHHARQRILVQTQLREALANGEIRAWFQPVVELPGGRVSGYEALVRWVRPDGSVVEPGAFVPTAERTDLVVALDRVVLADSLAVLARTDPGISVSVNVSAQSLSAPDMAEHVLAALERSRIAAARLHLEITETALVHVTDDVKAGMRAVAACGVGWYVDDFGTGYSSITHLRDLPVSGLKLDRSFTSGLGSGDVTSERIAQALAGLARGLELDTVAEGVETRSQADLLASLGWVHAQGWLYGRAVPPAQVP